MFSLRFVLALAIVIASIAGGLAAPGVAAQAGTPTTAVAGDRIVPLPAECTIAPRSAESLLALAAPPGDAPAAPLDTGEIPFGAFAGTPVDAATAAEYTALVRMMWACSNAGDAMRLFAVFSDDHLRRDYTSDELILLAEPADATPMAADEAEYSVIFAVLGIEELSDGRVGAYVVVDTPFDPLPVEINYLIAATTADGWRVDEFICFDAQGQPC